MKAGKRKMTERRNENKKGNDNENGESGKKRRVRESERNNTLYGVIRHRWKQDIKSHNVTMYCT